MSSPIPASTEDPAAPIGVATGHDGGFGPFIAASGPYMLAGSDLISVTGPPETHRPAPGFARLERFDLVRNPSWMPADDPLRLALADRITLLSYPDAAAAQAAIETDKLDLMLDQAPPVPRLEAFRDDPALSGRFHATAGDTIRYILMNLAIPPMDDVHVRRAASLVLDRRALRQLTGQAQDQLTEPVHHLVPDSMLADLLLRYDPYRTPDDAGDAQKARDEMALSAYDKDHDGRCDDPKCRHVRLMSRAAQPFPALAAKVAAALATIGIQVDITESTAFIDDLSDPAKGAAMSVDITYFKDYPAADTFFLPLLYRRSDAPEYWNPMGVGMTAEDLKAAGLTGPVPTLNPRIEACLGLLGLAQEQCWAELDQFVMEEMVVAIPYSAVTTARTTSSRVATFAFDRVLTFPALDRVGVTAGP
jgi:ABC-type transport system substrate-binding protein